MCHTESHTAIAQCVITQGHQNLTHSLLNLSTLLSITMSYTKTHKLSVLSKLDIIVDKSTKFTNLQTLLIPE